MSNPDAVLSFWFGELDEHGNADADHRKSWWKKSPEFDAEIRERFGAAYETIMNGGHRDWLDTPRGRLAYVIVLDQFSRNMFRDDAKMYAGDTRAVAAATEGIERGDLDALRCDEQVFLVMPLMHSEALADQERCVKTFEALAESHRGTPAFDKIENNVDFAIKHRDIVAAWGRFPHRNAILGRDSTPEEEAFLKKPGSSF